MPPFYSDMDSSTSAGLDRVHADRPRLAALAWAHFLNDGAANYLPGVLPAILVSLNLSVTYAGLFMAALLIGQALQPLTGLLADRIGGRLFIVVGLAGASIGGALVGLMPNRWSLLGLLIATGLCNSLFHPQSLAAVRAIGGRRHGGSMSIFLVGGEIGRGAWPVIASWLVTARGLHALWLIAIPSLLTLPVLWRYAPAAAPRPREATPLHLRAHAGPLARLVAFCALRSVMILSVVTFLPVLWHQGGGSLTGGASFITVLLLVGIIGNLGGGRAGDRIGRRPVIITAIVAGVALLAGFMGASGLLAWVLLALLGVALFSTLPLTVLIAQDILPENRSMGSGLALGFSNALGALGVVALGPVADVWGVSMALWAAVICGGLAIPLALSLPHGGRVVEA
ncbi:MAG TPA: MFS transporter [Gammaproteobacteria bacterium]|nr:MFS transporter [Gammaproteobacteria bacterium]